MAKVVPLDKFAKELKEYSDKNITAYKKAVVDSMTDEMKNLVANSPVDTGLYAQAWSMTVDEKSAMIGNTAPYAPMIEFGSRPYTPPIKPLLEWARRVLQKSEVDSECWALAKGVQNKIAERGLEPKHILGDAIERIINEIRIKMKEQLG